MAKGGQRPDRAERPARARTPLRVRHVPQAMIDAGLARRARAGRRPTTVQVVPERPDGVIEVPIVQEASDEASVPLGDD